MSVAPAEINLPKTWATPFVMPARKAGAAIVASPKTTTTFEACGEWLQKSLWATQVKQKIDRIEQSKAGGPAGSGPSGDKQSKERSKKGGSKLSEEDLETNWYEVMGIEEETAHLLTADEMRTLFRKRCIETHPDKMPDHSDKLFKQVARGNDILMNENSRRAFDSSRAFDDAIPGAIVSEDKYYESFAPVFVRNTKFSLDLPLPTLGDENTPIEEVKKFYDAWYRFRSWRDFSSRCELDKIEENMDRYEKRHYMKENQHKLDKHSKAEMKRIRDLVDRAHDNDPRIRKEREDKVLAEEKAKAEREEERERLMYERTRAAREAAEAEKKAAADKILKAKGDKEALKDLRLSLMAFFTDNELLDPSQSNMLCDDEVKQKNINWLSQKSNAQQIAELMAEIVNKSVKADADGKIEAVLFFNECVKKTEENIGQNRYGEAIKSTKQKQQEEDARLLAIEMAKPMKDRKVATFEADENKILIRGAVKFPEGTGDRVKKINNELKETKRADKFSTEQMTKKIAEIDAEFVANPKSKPVAPDMSHKARLIRHLTQYNPAKVGMADAMLEKYAGKEEDWIKALVKKFGPEPEPEWK